MIPTNISSTTNYTNMNDAINAGKTNSFIVYVCHNAKIYENETIDVIDSGVHIMGDVSLGNVLAYLVVENMNEESTFVIDTPNGDVIIFENINIVAKNNLFTVVGQSTLTLYNVGCFFGQKCLVVATDTSGSIPPGVVAETVVFMSNVYGIFHATGFITCNHCTFYNQITGAMITNNTAINPWAFFSMYDQHYINTLFPMGYQTSITGAIAAPQLSEDYIDKTKLFNCQTYFDPTSSNAFGSGTDTCPPCAECPSCRNTRLGEIIFGIGFWAMVFACYWGISHKVSSKKSANKK